MTVEVSVLENFGREAELRKKWLQVWEELGVRIRLAIMEMIQNAKRSH